MKTPDLSRQDSEFLRYLRGLAIFIVVFGHVGGFWFYRPYSGFLLVSVPIFFMISGAVSYPSYRRSGPLSFYLAKRTISLLIPYYLLCLLCLGFYLLQEGRLPSFSAERLIRWLLIRPSKEMMPFPIGQIWFLYVLLIISFLSPLYFFLWKRFPRVLGLICLLFLMLSLLQHFSDISQNFHLLFFDFFKPLICSLFFIFGFVFFSASKDRPILFWILSFVFFFIASFLFYLFRFDPDLAAHAHPPDLYYVSVSFFFIFLILLFRFYFLNILYGSKPLLLLFDFFYRHTFSIFLLHSLAIFLVEEYLGFRDSPAKTILWGGQKFFWTLLLTIPMAVPFSLVSNLIHKKLVLFLEKLINKAYARGG